MTVEGDAPAGDVVRDQRDGDDAAEAVGLEEVRAGQGTFAVVVQGHGQHRPDGLCRRRRLCLVEQEPDVVGGQAAHVAHEELALLAGLDDPGVGLEHAHAVVERALADLVGVEGGVDQQADVVERLAEGGAPPELVEQPVALGVRRLALGDVAQQHLDGGFAAEVDAGGPRLDDHEPPVQPHHPQLDAGDAALGSGGHPLRDERPLLGVDEVEHLPAHELVGRVRAEQADGRGVDENHRPVGVHHHRVGVHLHEHPVAVLALEQGRLAPLAFVDLAEVDADARPRGVEAVFEPIAVIRPPLLDDGGRAVLHGSP